jgi:hypothetical protein
MIRLHVHPLPPSSPRQLVSLSQSSCVKLTERRGGGVGVEPNPSLYLHRLVILSVMKAYPRVLNVEVLDLLGLKPNKVISILVESK